MNSTTDTAAATTVAAPGAHVAARAARTTRKPTGKKAAPKIRTRAKADHSNVGCSQCSGSSFYDLW
jgi:hypothetical protein